jgi:hypothetical protein
MAINLDHQQNKISSESKTIKIDQTGSLVMPVGTQSQRPSAPEQGAQRWNTTTNQVEFWNGTAWVSPSTIVSGEVYVSEGDAIAYAIALGG